MKWLEQTGGDISDSLKIDNQINGSPLERNEHIDLTENSRTILEKRYLRKGEDGNPIETIEEMFDRVATAVAAPDEGYNDVGITTTKFYNMLTTKKFFPNSPTFTGAGTPLGQLAACFVLPLADDMGRSPDGIFSTLRNAALVQQTGGGNGFSFSDLRSAGTYVSKSGGKASGPLGFLKVYDGAFGEVAQGGVRRGANMAVLRVDHPDIKDFIKCKSAEGEISNFNISIAVTDVFMNAVKNDTTYELIDPHTKQVTETPKAREIFNMIVKYSFHNGEPGILFIDEANRYNPVPHLYELKATNPCGEQFLGPYENCCLGSINLLEHLDEFGRLDWEELKKTTILGTQFLDNVVSANAYVPAVPQLRIAAEGARRIGLGFMGLADVMYSMDVRYGSDEAQEFSAQIVEFIRFHSMKTSVELSEERGPFKEIEGSIYDPSNLKWVPPKPLSEFRREFGRPALDWNEITLGIKRHGIRNAAQMTVAPTGTISTVAGLEGYGCEPVFALAYYRNVYQASGTEEGLTLTYTSPMFLKALDDASIEGDRRKRIIDAIIEKGSCQDIDELPKEIRDVFVVSADITPEEHIKMQAAIQAFIDNSISKTCNFPEGATEEDVAEVYKLGWELGCKGLTVYVTGSRDEVVLETRATKDSKNQQGAAIPTPTHAVFDRAFKLSGNTYKVATPQGKAFVTVNRDERGHPFEVFINVGKAGSDVAGMAEALGRLLSGWLRSSVIPDETVKEVVVQLIGIGGSRSVGFGQNRVASIPDAIAKVLADDFGIKVKTNGETKAEGKGDEPKASSLSQADMCPDCGNTSLIQSEGCEKCIDCGYSVC